MENLILIVHLLVALAIIGLILLQQGKGAEMGASFGAGASQTLFGSTGSGNFFSRMTAILATVFFITSFTLAIMSKQRTGEIVDDDLPPAVEEIKSDMSIDNIPEVDDLSEDLPEVENPETSTETDLPDVSETEE